MLAPMRRARADYVNLWRAAPGAITRVALTSVGAVMGLAVAQLVLTLCLHEQYVEWFLAQHGWNRSTAPDGEVFGIYLGLGLRAVFSLAWIWSFSRLMALIAKRDRTSLVTMRGYAVTCLVGYGYLTWEGGPWWVMAIRAAQCCLGGVMGIATLAPRTASWFAEHGKQPQTS